MVRLEAADQDLRRADDRLLRPLDGRSDAWDGVRRDVRMDDHPGRVLHLVADEDAGKSAVHAPVLEPGAAEAASAPCTRGAARFAEQ